MSSEDRITKPVKPLLIVGIVLLPIIFVWALLEKGYSKQARTFGFSWLLFCLLVNLSRIIGLVDQHGILSVLMYSWLFSCGFGYLFAWIHDTLKDDSYGITFSKDLKERFKKTKEQAIKGIAEAQLELGVFYETGIGTKKDSVEALRWYKLSADNGDAAGQAILGTKYEKGTIVQKDYNKAFQLYSLSAQQGCQDGQYELARCYLDGIGVVRDEKEATRLLKQNSDQGHIDSQILLGKTYYNYNLFDKAEHQYSIAATQDNDKAQYLLGRFYETRNRFPESAKWYIKAANNGHIASQYKLIEIYYDGNGVEQSDEQALFWFYVAVGEENKYSDDIRYLTIAGELSKRISEAKMNKIYTEAESFKIELPYSDDY